MKSHSNDDYYTVKILRKDLESLSIVEEGEKILGSDHSTQVYEQTTL